MFNRILLVLMIALCSPLAAAKLQSSNPQTASLQPPYQINIGSGSTKGLYHPAAEAVCDLINKYNKNIQCHVITTSGSLENLQLLRTGKINFAIVQSDTQYNAYQGDKALNLPPFSNMRAVFAIHGEPFTIIVRANSQIETLKDLKGKSISIGQSLSGEHATIMQFIHLLGWNNNDFTDIKSLDAKTEISTLCDKQVDAIITVIGHPNETIKEMALTCPIRLLAVTGEEVKLLTQSSPFYVPMQIPAEQYRGNHLATPTFGVQATLVTTTTVPETIVYALVKTFFTHLEDFKNTHYAFHDIETQNMLLGNSAPYAEGALHFYKEKGWIMHVAW